VVLTALGTAIAMGTNFDQYIITTVFSKEGYKNKGAESPWDAPEDSNAVATDL